MELKFTIFLADWLVIFVLVANKSYFKSSFLDDAIKFFRRTKRNTFPQLFEGNFWLGVGACRYDITIV